MNSADLHQNQSSPRVHDAPAADRPRERLLSSGAAALRTAELLAILIRSGRTGESALQAGEKIAAHFKDQLDRLTDAGRGELREISPAVAETAYCQIMAGIELGRRVVQAAQTRGDGQLKTSRILGSEDALLFCTRGKCSARPFKTPPNPSCSSTTTPPAIRRRVPTISR